METRTEITGGEVSPRNERFVGRRYDVDDHASLLIYLLTYPLTCYAVAKSLGYSGKAPGEKVDKDDQDMNSWYISLLFQYYLADQPGGERSGAKSARIFIDHSFPSVPALGLLVQEIADELAKHGDET